MKKIFILIIIVAIVSGGYFLLSRSSTTNNTPENKTTAFQPDPSSATFTIDNEPITLSHGARESEEGEITLLDEKATGDLNNDNKADTALLLADSSIGSGVFIYVAAYVSGPVSYKGTNAVFVGDRISPQSLSIANGVVTFKYLDRKAEEPFSAEPTISITKQFFYKNSELVEK